jgi:hypothetical protein
VPMDYESAYRLTRRMAAIWPRTAPEPDTLRDEWIPEIVTQNLDTATTALEALKRSEDFFPSFRGWHDAYRVAAHNRRLELASIPQLEEAPATPERVAYWRTDIAGRLAAAKGPLTADLRRATSQ